MKTDTGCLSPGAGRTAIFEGTQTAFLAYRRYCAKNRLFLDQVFLVVWVFGFSLFLEGAAKNTVCCYHTKGCEGKMFIV